MVRPEWVRVGVAQVPGGLPATVVAVVFQGPVVHCALRAADGTELVAHLGPAAATPAFVPGQQVFVDWDPDAPRLLPPAGNGGGA
jgi:spermidine/putrescine transport system ATP-binding protein